MLPGVAGVACGTGTTMTGTGVADEATLFCGVATPGVATTWLGALGAGTCVVCSAAGVTLVTELVTCWALVFPARVYPAAIPITAVAESPVTRIFAAVAGVLVVRRVEADLVGMVFSAVLSVVGVEGGGGGSSAIGSNGSGGTGGNGGAGTANTITGSSVLYAGGGGGGASATGGTNAAGGGTGGVNGNAGAAGTANSGSGGGGGAGNLTAGQNFAGGNGGSGVVIISVPSSAYTGNVTGSPTVTTNGTQTVITFTQSGSYTA